MVTDRQGAVTTAEPRGGVDLRAGVLLCVALAFFGGVSGALATAGGDPHLAAQYAGVGFLLGAILVALRDWRTGLALLLVVVLAEDSLRKGLPGTPYAVSLGKDLLVAACYLSFLFRPADRIGVRRGSRGERVLVYLPLLVWSVFVVMQAFNPHLPHILVGISGIRTWILFVPLMGLLAHTFRSSDDADMVLRWIAYLAIPFAAVALLQNMYFDSLPAFLANSAFAKFRSLESGDHVRYIESVFASPTLYSLVCVFQLCLVVGLLKIPRPRRQTLLLWLAGYASVAGAHLSGVRTGLLFCAAAVLALLPLILIRHERVHGGRARRPGLILGGMAGLMIGAVLIGSMQPARAEAFWSGLEISIVGERMEESLAHVRVEQTPPLGFGTGAAGKSGQIMTLLGGEAMGFEEVEWGNLLVRYCFGPVGMWFGLFLLLWMLAGLFRIAWRNRMARFAPVRFALWVYLCAQMGWFLFKAYPVMENGTMLLMFWSAAGLIIGLGRLDEREQALPPV
jgi:hypothetical protein